MPTIAGWTPPSFHPDGTLTSAELAPQSKTTIRESSSSKTTASNTGQRGTDWPAAEAAAKLPSEAASFQWGEKPPACAVVFGGLNSMYVTPEVWILPLRWRENTVQFSPPNPEPEPQEERNEKPHNGKSGGGLGGLGFASTVRLKRAAGLAAATARGRVTAAAAAGGGATVGGNGEGDDTWRLFQAGRVGEGRGAGKHRRASLPGGFTAGAAALGLDILRSHEQQRHEIAAGVVGGAGGGAAMAGQRDDDDRVGMQESAAEIEVS